MRLLRAYAIRGRSAEAVGADIKDARVTADQREFFGEICNKMLSPSIVSQIGVTVA